MTAIWFGLAAACLLGAGILLHFDRQRRARSGRTRQVWAKNRGYSYKSIDPGLPATWRRATLAKQGYLSAVDIAHGSRRGVRFTLFDLEDAATIVAVQRRVGSPVDIDLRLKTTPPPKDSDLELLGAMGDRVVFATDLDLARRVCDQRMAALAEILPDNLQVIWSENDWTLGSMPVTATPREWDQAIDGVIRFSGLLYVLPPADVESDRNGGSRRSGGDNPSRPIPRAQPRGPEPFDREEIEPPPPIRPMGPPRRAPQRGEGDPPPPPPRWMQPEEERSTPAPSVIAPSPADAGLPDKPGGPFHPGFRPYQGPARS